MKTENEMLIDQINRRHKLTVDMRHKVEGLSSKLLSVENQVITIQVITEHRNKIPINDVVYHMAHLWKRKKEFEHCIGAKVYVIDGKKHRNKSDLIDLGVKTNYNHKMGIFFRENYLNWKVSCLD